MKKILLINGGIRRGGQTSKVIALFKNKFGDTYEIETIDLYQANLMFCKGCAVCLSRGEDLCPCKDDRDMLLEKMDKADIILFASPNYSLSVTHLMKNFLERFAFVFHRPRFFGKVFSSLVTQGSYGGGKIANYLKEVAGFWGGVCVTGTVLTLPNGAYDPSKAWNKNEEAKIHQALEKMKKRIAAALESNLYPKPSLFKLIVFRFTRSSHKYLGQDNKDFRHFTEKGWFELPYFYNVKLGIIKSLIGSSADYIAKKLITKTKGKD